jgi:oligopeptide/dipeptide ABC transporter ATP-binding protein
MTHHQAQVARRPTEPLLTIEDLYIEIPMRQRRLFPVQGVSLSIGSGEAVGLVGESGCGKTMTGLSIMGLLPAPAHVVRGSVRFDGRELVGLTERELRSIRGRGTAMVFQDPLTSLNPLMRVGPQIAEAVRLHHGVSKGAARSRATDCMKQVRLPRPRTLYDAYPHQLSGGMRQRAMLAMALASSARLLIADEPTTALDVTTEARILDALDELRHEQGMALLLITHDIRMVSTRIDRLVVMYAGMIVEEGPVAELVSNPAHPYTAALLRSMVEDSTPARERLATIPGAPPVLHELLAQCGFAERCPYARADCREGRPDLREYAAMRSVRCVSPIGQISA